MVRKLENEDLIYLDGYFFNTYTNEDRFTFLNKKNNLIYLKKGDNYYQQISEKNPFLYIMDNSVSELKDLKQTNWGVISSYDKDNGTNRLYQYIVDKLSNFKKPEENYIYDFGHNSMFENDVYINNDVEIRININELLYVPKRIKDEELNYSNVLVVNDDIFLMFTRFLSKSMYRIIYDKNFDIVKEGEVSLFDKDLWEYLKRL